jgi:hypothetical protein
MLKQPDKQETATPYMVASSVSGVSGFCTNAALSASASRTSTGSR